MIFAVLIVVVLAFIVYVYAGPTALDRWARDRLRRRLMRSRR